VKGSRASWGIPTFAALRYSARVDFCLNAGGRLRDPDDQCSVLEFHRQISDSANAEHVLCSAAVVRAWKLAVATDTPAPRGPGASLAARMG